MKKNLKQTWKIIRYNIGNLLLFETGYRITAFFLVMWLIEFLIDFSLKQQGFRYLTLENYKEFLQCPLTIVFLILIFFVIFIFYFIEVSALVNGFAYSNQKKKLYVEDFLIIGIKQAISFFRCNIGGCFLCIVCSIPFMAFYFVLGELFYMKILEFMVRQIYKEIQFPIFLCGFLIVLFMISFLFIFTLPYCILKKEKGYQGFLSGFKLLKARWKRIVAGFLVLHLCMLLFVVVTYGFVLVIFTTGVFFLKPEAMKIRSVFIYSEYVNMFLGIYAGGVQIIGSIAFLYTIYAQFHGQLWREHSFYKKRTLYCEHFKWSRRKAMESFMLAIVLLEGFSFSILSINHDVTLNRITTDTKITAHRGGAWKAPENTISALQYAINQGIDYAEVDVQETKDGALILLHDDSFKRTAGVKKKVWEMSLEEVKKLDVGNSFHKEFKGEKIPELTEALKFCKGRLDLNIEIKYNSKNKGIVNKVVQAIKENHFEEHCVVTSMNYQVLQEIKQIAPDIRTGYIMTMPCSNIARMESADLFSIKYTYVDEQFITQAHAMGKEVYVWTVDNKGEVKRMLDMGVDNIITDDPLMVRKVQRMESEDRIGYFELLRGAFYF